jgi:ABC-type transport system involved in multi-copper enzyme maturation permease subunit
MNSELLKLRSLPTPRWTLAGVVAAFVITIVVAAIIGPRDGAVVFLLAVGLPTSIASIVLGAWMAGVEYGQGTIRRALTADPRRLRLVGAKVGVVLAVVTGLSVVPTLAAAAPTTSPSPPATRFRRASPTWSTT